MRNWTIDNVATAVMPDVYNSEIARDAIKATFLDGKGHAMVLCFQELGDMHVASEFEYKGKGYWLEGTCHYGYSKRPTRRTYKPFVDMVRDWLKTNEIKSHSIADIANYR